ncbi:MAG: hypothetical protein P9M14_13925 [Candidatus Alcyoniella australis]|nr:hypothetical protein [Candidatus Alcyoniella australis]
MFATRRIAQLLITVRESSVWRALLLAVLCVSICMLSSWSLMLNTGIEQASMTPTINMICVLFTYNQQLDYFDTDDPVVQSVLRSTYAGDQSDAMFLAYKYSSADPGHSNQVTGQLVRTINKQQRGNGAVFCPNEGLGLVYFQSGDYKSAADEWENYLTYADANGINDYIVRETRWQVLKLRIALGEYGRALQILDSFPEDQDRPASRTLKSALIARLSLLINADNVADAR